MTRRPRLSTSLVAMILAAILDGCQPSGNRIELPSRFPIRYSVGEVDPRFGITRERFLTLVREAESKWEDPANGALFDYDPTSDFVVSLVFDHRQQRTIDARQAKAALDDRERSIRDLMADYNRAAEDHGRLTRVYETELAGFTERLDRYNASVAEWNRKGGAPPDEFAKLKAEEQRLAEMRASVDRTMNDANNAVTRQNNLAERINALADEFNLDVNLYNGRFVESREFEQGQYDGKGIVVYQFTEESDLRVALMHEFGHALGFGHLDAPEAIMHRRLEKQNILDPQLTNDDLALLKATFNF